MAAYSVEDLKEVIEDHVVFVRVPVLANGTDGELNDECTEQLDKIRSRSGMCKLIASMLFVGYDAENILDGG